MKFAHAASAQIGRGGTALSLGGSHRRRVSGLGLIEEPIRSGAPRGGRRSPGSTQVLHQVVPGVELLQADFAHGAGHHLAHVTAKPVIVPLMQ